MKKIWLFPLIFYFLSLGLAHAAQVNKIAAVVNGQPITMFDLQKEAIPELARARVNPNDKADQAKTKEILRKTLDVLILDILVAQEAKRLKATVSASEIDNEITRIMKERNLNKKQFEAALKQQNLTLDALRKNMEKSLLRQKVMGMEVGRRVIVTPEEIKNYYEAHKDEMIDRKGLHMGLLVYRPNVNAASIAAQIKSGAISFKDACAKYSVAPNANNNGDTGEIAWNRLNPEWEGRLTRMKPGEVTEIFPLNGFKAQVQLYRPGGGGEKRLSLQEATPQIDAILRAPKAKGRFEDYSKQLRDKAVIDIRL